MPERTLIIVAALFILSIVACAHDPSASNVPAPAATLVKIDITAREALLWTYRQEMDADLDGDGKTETITIVSDVETSSTGQPLWEDGHRWAVVIQEGGRSTLAYAAFVPRGFSEIALLHRSSDGSRELLVNERTPEQLMSVTISYGGLGEVEATSASYYQIESWFPRSARLPD